MFRSNRLLPILSCVIMSLHLAYAGSFPDHTSGLPQDSRFMHDSIRQKCDRLRQQNDHEPGSGGAYTIYGVINQKAQVGGPVLLCSGPFNEFKEWTRGDNTMVYYVPYSIYVKEFNNLKDNYSVLASAPSCFTIRLFDTFDSQVPDGVAADLQYYSSLTAGMAELTFVPDIEPGLYVLVCIVYDGILLKRAPAGTRIYPSRMAEIDNYMLTIEGSVLDTHAIAENYNPDSIAGAFPDSTSGLSLRSRFMHNTIRQKCNILRYKNNERHNTLYSIHGVVNQKAQVGGPVLLCAGQQDRWSEYTDVYYVDYDKYISTYNRTADYKDALRTSPSSFTIRLFHTFDSKVPSGVASDLSYYSNITAGMAELAFVPDIEPGLYVLVCKVHSDLWGDMIWPIAGTTSNLSSYLLIVEGSVDEETATTKHVESQSVHSRVQIPNAVAITLIALVSLMVLAITIILMHKYQVKYVMKQRK